jgi:hypothetical protein
MGRKFSKRFGEDECIHGFDGKAIKRENTKKT